MGRNTKISDKRTNKVFKVNKNLKEMVFTDEIDEDPDFMVANSDTVGVVEAPSADGIYLIGVVVTVFVG